MMLTQPSLHDSTNSDISACESEIPPHSQVLGNSRCQAYECVPNLSKVVKVVFPPIPAVSCLQTLCFIGDVAHIQSVAIVKLSFEQLDTQKDVSTNICHKMLQGQDHTAAQSILLQICQQAWPELVTARHPCTSRSSLYCCHIQQRSTPASSTLIRARWKGQNTPLDSGP